MINQPNSLKARVQMKLGKTPLTEKMIELINEEGSYKAAAIKLSEITGEEIKENTFSQWAYREGLTRKVTVKVVAR